MMGGIFIFVAIFLYMMFSTRGRDDQKIEKTPKGFEFGISEDVKNVVESDVANAVTIVSEIVEQEPVVAKNDVHNNNAVTTTPAKEVAKIATTSPQTGPGAATLVISIIVASITAFGVNRYTGSKKSNSI